MSAAYSRHTQELIAKEIQLELQAAHNYRAFGAYFASPLVAYPGFAKYFSDSATEELGHADAFIKYHQDRGLIVRFPQVDPAPEINSIESALLIALQMETSVRDNLNAINKNADPQTQVFIQTYIEIQTKSIAEVQTL